MIDSELCSFGRWRDHIHREAWSGKRRAYFVSIFILLIRSYALRSSLYGKFEKAKHMRYFLTVALGLILIGLSIKIFFTAKELEIRVESPYLTANGVSTLTTKAVLLNPIGIHIPSNEKQIDIMVTKGREKIDIIQSKHASLLIQSKLAAGDITINASYNGMIAEKTITILPSYSDSDADGFPDVCELTGSEDKLNFRRWFVSVAESQFYETDHSWYEGEQDCAGLARFAYREALKKHSDEWLAKREFLTEVTAPDVRKYNYPNVPILETKIFRTREGAFNVNDQEDNIFSISATAKILKEFNTIYVGKEPEAVQPGDLLFFLNPVSRDMPYHTMIYIGDDNGMYEKDNDDWLVYHTGPDDNTKGIVKKIRRSDLMKHPHERWHPVPGNPYFLGYYRWKILEN